MNNRFALIIILSAIILVNSTFCQAADQTPDPRVKPGTTFYVDFPSLDPANHQDKTVMGVYIPTDYSEDKLFPLFVWFGGGSGNHEPGPAKSVVEGKGFICVGVPYQKHNGEEIGPKMRGLWASPWDHYKVMLDELEKIIPNINKNSRICGGFSSGGAAIMWLLGNSGGKFQEYFAGFMPGGAGWPMGGLSDLKNRPLLVFTGETDTRYANLKKIYDEALKSGVDVKFLVFKGEGHVFPSQYYPEIVDWMKTKVVRRNLPTTTKQMKSAIQLKKYGTAIKCAREIKSITEPDMPEYSEAENALQTLSAIGEQESEKMISGSANLSTMKQFVSEWSGFDFTDKVALKCNEIAEQQFDKLISQNQASARNLKTFLGLWNGYSVYDKGMEKYDELARQELIKIQESGNKSIEGQKLARFIQTWQPALCVQEAQERLENIALEILDEIKEINNEQMRKSKLRSFVRMFGETKAGKEASALLK